MKNLVTLFLCISVSAFSQNNVIYDAIQQSKSAGQIFGPVSALAPADSAFFLRKIRKFLKPCAKNPQPACYFIRYFCSGN